MRRIKGNIIFSYLLYTFDISFILERTRINAFIFLKIFQMIFSIIYNFIFNLSRWFCWCPYLRMMLNCLYLLILATSVRRIILSLCLRYNLRMWFSKHISSSFWWIKHVLKILPLCALLNRCKILFLHFLVLR